MYSKDAFLTAIKNTIQNYPAAAVFFNAGDPRMLAQLEAIATMLAMVSSQVETAALEPYLKSRDATVWAEAALKGILPFARPATGKVTITNNDTSGPVTIAAGRRLLDSAGRRWEVLTPATIAAKPVGGVALSATVDVIQRTVYTQAHTVVNTAPFYAVEVDQPPSDQFIAEVSVTRGDGTSFDYAPRFVNVSAGDKVFTVEMDEYRRTFVKFGFESV